MDFVEYLVSHPEYLHCKICIAFTPDEEIGKGTDHFDVAFFNADFAYTIDGGSIHEINYENFNAASAEVSIYGNSIHPGSAKGKMKNSILIAQEFNALLPQDAIPSKTEGYEGFHHLCDIQGNCEKTILNYILRDHDLNLLTKQKHDRWNSQPSGRCRERLPMHKTCRRAVILPLHNISSTTKMTKQTAEDRAFLIDKTSAA